MPFQRKVVIAKVAFLKERGYSFSSRVCGQDSRNLRAFQCSFQCEYSRNFFPGPDCVAEEERFELSVRFCRAKPRRVRKLQIAKPCQRISPETRHQNWAISPVSIRHLFVRERRMQGDSVAKMVTS